MGSKYTAAELRKKIKAELLELVETEGIELEEGDGVGDIRAKLLEIEVSEDEDELDDDEVDDSDEVEDDEVDDTEDDELDDDEEDDIEDPEVDDVTPPAKAKAKAKAAPVKKTKYTEGGKDGEGNKLLGAKEVAAHIGTDAKTLRQFFRSGKSSFQAVGAGGRYEFNEVDLPKIKAEFDGWKANKPGRGRASDGTAPKKSRGKSQPKADEVIDEVEEIEDLDELDDIELDD